MYISVAASPAVRIGFAVHKIAEIEHRRENLQLARRHHGEHVALLQDCQPLAQASLGQPSAARVEEPIRPQQHVPPTTGLGEMSRQEDLCRSRRAVAGVGKGAAPDAAGPSQLAADVSVAPGDRSRDFFRGIQALPGRLVPAGMESSDALHAIYAVVIDTSGFVAWQVPRRVRQPKANYAAAWRQAFAAQPPHELPLVSGVLDRLCNLADREQFELGLSALARGLTYR
jgi:hypothetical protein